MNSLIHIHYDWRISHIENEAVVLQRLAQLGCDRDHALQTNLLKRRHTVSMQSQSAPCPLASPLQVRPLHPSLLPSFQLLSYRFMLNTISNSFLPPPLTSERLPPVQNPKFMHTTTVELDKITQSPVLCG